MRTLTQSPRPEVLIYNPGDDKPKLAFGADEHKTLLSYSFSTSVNDPRGSFSLTLHPAEVVFDAINELDIVEIYEGKNHHYSSLPQARNPRALPAFTGVVRSKKYVAQMAGNGVSRRASITGHSIAGLVSDFIVNLDLSAWLITKSKIVIEDFTNGLARKLNTNEPRTLQEVVSQIWKYYIEFSKTAKSSTTPKIVDYLNRWIGEALLFDVPGEQKLRYTLGSLILGRNNQNIYSLIDGLLPSPVYEKFAYVDYENGGKTRIKIRECPFDLDAWKGLKTTEIDPLLVKSIELTQSDSEVYTVYFSYIDGYPEDFDKIFKMAVTGIAPNSSLMADEKKYGIYGYRLLQAHYLGFATSAEHDDVRREDMNRRLKNWYDSLELMYGGSITMETDFSRDMPCPGEKIAMLGGEFYVVGAEHRWNYGEAPETTITVSRGGIYAEKEGAAGQTTKYTVAEGDTLKGIAVRKYGDAGKASLIVNANAALLYGPDRLKPEGKTESAEGLPWIFPGDKLDIPPDPGIKASEIGFLPLADVTSGIRLMIGGGK
jgi:hypothetical protein